MRRPILAIASTMALVTAFVTAQPVVTPDLAAMADAERAFAKAATVKGWRDAFLEFFADDAIAFTPAPASAKDRLRKQPSTPFSEFELHWEPRLGGVSASGDLGWLTGPSTAIRHTQKDAKPGYGCYLSIWRKQADGTWKVFIDVGADAPSPVTFAAGFNRITFGSRYAGKGNKEDAGKSLAEADRALNKELSGVGAAQAFGRRFTAASRLHRPGYAPIVGIAQAQTWLNQHTVTSTATEGAVESAAAGDFGYSYGTYDVTAPVAQKGAYVRLWNRDQSLRWWLMVDIAQPVRE